MFFLLKKRFQKLHKDDSGVAMIFALIVGVVVMVFCLALLLVTYTLYAQTSRQTTLAQCKLYAQTVSETIGEELKDTDSDLNHYLKNQIESNNWCDRLSEDMQPGAVKELMLDLTDNHAEGYNVVVALSYEISESEESDEPGEGEDDDDQDDDLKNIDGKKGANYSLKEEPDDQAGNGSYTIIAKIKCVRGDLSDSDAQMYEIEKTYQGVTLQKE